MLEPTDFFSAAFRPRLLFVVLLWLCVCVWGGWVCVWVEHLSAGLCSLGVCRKLLMSQVRTSPDTIVSLSEKASGNKPRLWPVFTQKQCVCSTAAKSFKTSHLSSGHENLEMLNRKKVLSALLSFRLRNSRMLTSCLVVSPPERTPSFSTHLKNVCEFTESRFILI